MSRLLELQERLRDTSAAIAHFEQAIAEDATSPSLGMMLKSVQKQQRALEAEFLTVAHAIGSDVCRYRFFADFIRPTVTPLCTALLHFQSLYSAAYDAVKNGPKKKQKKPTTDVLDETSFFFSHSFSGSVGVVLTFDNQKRMLFETQLDEAMQAVIDLAGARSSDAVVAMGRRLGVPPIRAMHRWAHDHAVSHLGADIEWTKGNEVLRRLLLQVADMEQLAGTIAGTTDVVEEEVEMVAMLAGADVQKKTFHLRLPDGEDVRGTFSEFVSPGRTFEVGRTHNVTLRKKVRIFFSTDEEIDASYQLILAIPVQESPKENG